MRLSEVAAGLFVTPAGVDPEILGITEDSRRVTPGMLFVAVRGTSLDGHGFVADAVARGAAALAVERIECVPTGVPTARVNDARAALAQLAARFYGTAALPLSIIGFTGTFGKTSTSEILRALLDAAGARTGVIGSLGSRYGTFHDPGHGLTTPTAVELHRSLRALHEAGATTVILEVTSHALRLGRVAGLQFAGGLLAAILPGEHTDFHRSYEDYVEAKRVFLGYLAPGATLAFDTDNRAARQLASEAGGARTAGFSLDTRAAQLQFSDIVLDPDGAAFTIHGVLAGPATGARLRSALLGPGHMRNAALALTHALAAGVPIDAARDVLNTLRPLRRRMERYGIAGRTILDDTAAHPDSLRGTFDVASLLPHESLVVVHAMRGNRGPEINRQNARALAALCETHGVRSLLVTGSSDAVGPDDRASAEEIDVTRQTFAHQKRAFTWHDTLRGALRAALDHTRAGDLVLLTGAQGMNEGKHLLLQESPMDSEMSG